MKKIRGIKYCLAFLIAVLCAFCLKTEVKAYSGSYTPGTVASGSITDYRDEDIYTFFVNANADMQVAFSASGNLNIQILDGRNQSINYEFRVSSWSGTYYLPAGKYSFKVSASYRQSGNYAFKISKVTPVLQLAQSQGQLDESAKQEVAFSYSCSKENAAANMTVGSKNRLVAEAEAAIYSNGTGILTIYPKALGQTEIQLSIAGGNTVTYTATVTGKTCYVAKGKSLKLSKPRGFSSLKWKSSKKSVATVSKSGKLKTKKDGRLNVTAKKGKMTFHYNIVVTDYVKLGKKAFKQIKEDARNPESVKIYNIYYGYDKNIINGYNIPVIFLDFGGSNAYGAMSRGKIIAYYNEVHELRMINVSSYSDITKRKRMSPTKIKK